MAIVIESWMGEDLDLGTSDTEHTHQSGGQIPGTKISLTTFSIAGVAGHATVASWEPVDGIAVSAQASTTVTVPGAQIGDLVLVSYTGMGTSALMISAHVSAADTVTVVLFNNTPNPVTPSGTLKVLVFGVR